MVATEEEEAEARSQLRTRLGRRVEVEGTVGRFSSVFDPRARREIPSVCVNNVEVRDGDHPVIDHVWVTWATILVNSGVREGDVVRFTAQVYQYPHRDREDHNKTTQRLGLREPRDLKCLNRELVKPEPEAVPVPPPSANGEPTEPDEPDLELPPVPVDPKRELLDAVWGLVERFGLARVKKTLAAVETLTADE